MDTLECMQTRRSVRKFLDIPVEMEKVGNILNAGRMAPSGGNLQDWKFILVIDEDMRKKIAEACLRQYWMERAPVHIIICSEPEKSKTFYGERGEKRYTIQNAAAATMNMLLAAHDQGLATCWVGAFEDDMIRRVLRIPDSVIPMAVLPIGYADEVVPIPPKFSLENITFFETWSARWVHFGDYYGYTSHHIQNLLKKGKMLLKRAGKKIGDV